MKPFWIALSIATLAGCGGGGGGNVEAGITVNFQAKIQQTRQADGTTPQAPAGSKQFRNSEGVVITLNKAYLTLWSVTLENDCAAVNFSRLFSFDWLLPAAHAHADLSPTRLATPNVVNLLAADNTALAMGNATPPPASYCGVTVALQQADNDAQYLPQDLDMIKRSVYLEGTYQLPGSAAVPFTLDTGRTLREAQRHLPVALTLSDTNRQGTVKLTITYDRWFDAVNFAQLSEQAQQDWILNQISQSVRVE